MEADLSLLESLLIVSIGMGAAILNTLAGGGSLLVLPVLIFLGLPDTTANGTIRLAVLLQTGISALRYHRAGQLDLRPLSYLAPPVIIGALGGAWVGATADDAQMRSVLTWAMLVGATLMTLRPTNIRPLQNKKWVAWPAMLAVGVYGGLVHAGVGLLMLSVMVLLLGYDLMQANILKIVLVLLYTPVGLVIFASQDRVDWKTGLILAVGQMMGGWIGAGIHLRSKGGLVRWLVAGVIVVVAIKMGFGGSG